jgi:hypothetical protein
MEMDQVRRNVLDEAMESMKNTALDLSEKDQDHLVYDLQAKLNMHQDEVFGRREFFENVLEQVQKENKAIQREKMGRMWRKIGLGVLASGLAIGLLLALIVSFSLHKSNHSSIADSNQ